MPSDQNQDQDQNQDLTDYEWELTCFATGETFPLPLRDDSGEALESAIVLGYSMSAENVAALGGETDRAPALKPVN